MMTPLLMALALPTTTSLQSADATYDDGGAIYVSLSGSGYIGQNYDWNIDELDYHDREIRNFMGTDGGWGADFAIGFGHFPAPDLDWLRLRYEVSFSYAEVDLDPDTHDISGDAIDGSYDSSGVSFNAYADLRFHRRLSGYVGFGLGVHEISPDITITNGGTTTYTDEEWDLTASFRLGLNFHISPQADLTIGFHSVSFLNTDFDGAQDVSVGLDTYDTKHYLLGHVGMEAGIRFWF